MPEWLVRLVGRKWDLQLLARVARDPWRVTQEDGKFYLRSSCFGTLGDAEAKRLADEFVDWADLHALLRFEGYQGVQTAEVVGLDPNGSRHVTIFPAVGHAEGFGSATAVSSSVKPKPFDLSRDTSCLKQRRFLMQGLRYVREEPGWYGYRKAAEALGEDIGGMDKIVSHGWATKEEWNRFRHTVDYYRHHRVPKPLNPMKKQEAKSFLLGLLQSCVDWRLSGGR